MYACTLRIARMRVDEAGHRERECVRLKNGEAGVVSSMLPMPPCAFRKGAIRQWAGLGRDRIFCAVTMCRGLSA